MNIENELEILRNKLNQLEQENHKLKRDTLQNKVNNLLFGFFSNCKDVAVIISDSKKRLVFANKGASEIFDIHQDQMCIEDAFLKNILLPDDYNLLLENHKHAIENKLEVIETICKIKVGKQEKSVLFEDTLCILEEENETTNYIIYSKLTNLSHQVYQPISDDIYIEKTRRIGAETALRENEAKLRSFFEQSANGIVFINSQQIIIDFNHLASEMLEFNKEIVFNKSIESLFCKLAEKQKITNETSRDFISKLTFYFQNYTTFKTNFLYEFEFFSNRGKLNISISVFPINNSGEVFFGGILRDITVEKNNESELEKYHEYLEEVIKERTIDLIQSEHRIKNLSDSLPGGAIFRAIRTDDHVFKLDYVSGNFYELIGVDPAMDYTNLVGIYDNIHPSDRDKFLKQKEISRYSLSDFNLEVRYYMPQGNTKWFQIRAKANVTDNGKVFWDGYVIDTTEKPLSY
ncbi:MAG: PAS domain S-box protein [Bacteroidales bacterium]|nr:PAS domain S-box protein [Bacteroidales bacterium]